MEKENWSPEIKMSFNTIHRLNSGFSQKELEEIDKDFSQKNFEKIFSMIQKLKSEIKTKDKVVLDKLVYLVIKLCFFMEIHNKGTVLQDFILNIWFNEVLSHHKVSLLSKSILRNEKLYYRSHIWYFGYIDIVEDKVEDIIAELILNIWKPEWYMYIEILIKVVVNYSIFLFHQGAKNPLKSFYQNLIKLIENKKVNNKYLNYVYIHLFYFLIRLWNITNPILKRNIFSIKSDELKPYLYVQHKLVCIEYMIETNHPDLNEDDIKELEEYIKTNEKKLDNDSYIYFNFVYGKYYYKKFLQEPTKQEIITTVKDSKPIAEFASLKEEWKEKEQIEWLKKSAQDHFEECVKMLDLEENALWKIEPIIYLLKMEKDTQKQKELFFQGRHIISKNLWLKFDKSFYGKEFIKLWKEYILKNIYSKISFEWVWDDMVFNMIHSEYKSYMSQNIVRTSLDMDKFEENIDSKNYIKNILDSLISVFPNIRLIIKDLESDDVLLNLNWPDEKIVWDYFKDFSKLQIWKRKDLEYKKEHLFQDFFSLTMKWRKIRIDKKEYWLIFDRGAMKEEKFEGHELIFIYKVIRNFLLKYNDII